MNVRMVVLRLTAVAWNWRDVERSLVEGGFRKRQAVDGRSTFESEDGVVVDVYFVGEDPSAVEATVAFENAGRLPADEYEARIDEWHREFTENIKVMINVLGRPAFVGGSGDEGFPDDQESMFLGLWKLKDARLMLQLNHEDRELPIRLCVVVTPAER
jgi:hypothetical protein